MVGVHEIPTFSLGINLDLISFLWADVLILKSASTSELLGTPLVYLTFSGILLRHIGL
jgi:hypothetical protein